jgi:hypothetical protein
MSMVKLESRLEKLETVMGSDDDVMICHWHEEPGITEIGSIRLNGVEVVRGTDERREDFVKRACDQFNAKGLVWADLRSVWPNKVPPFINLEDAQ